MPRSFVIHYNKYFKPEEYKSNKKYLIDFVRKFCTLSYKSEANVMKEAMQLMNKEASVLGTFLVHNFVLTRITILIAIRTTKNKKSKE